MNHVSNPDYYLGIEHAQHNTIILLVILIHDHTV